MKKNYEFKVDVSSFSVAKVKDILWQLYYSPEDAFKRLKVTEEDVASEMLVEALIKKHPNLLFGKEQTFLSTEGVDLGIKSPVVRDVILERCHKAIEEEDHCIEKAVKLLRTEDNGEEASYKRLIGGLKEIGFKNKEANYLAGACNLYPVALLLDRLNQQSVVEAEDTAVAVETEDEVQEVPVPVSSDFITNIVSNKESVDKLLSLISEEDKNLADIEHKYESLKAEFDRLNKLLAVANELEQAGISFDELLARKDKVESLFEAINCLAVA